MSLNTLAVYQEKAFVTVREEIEPRLAKVLNAPLLAYGSDPDSNFN